MAASKYLCSCKWTLHGNALSWVPVGVPAVCVWQWRLPCPVGAAAAQLPPAPLSLQVPIVHLHETQSHFGCLCLVRYVPLRVMVPLNNCLSALNKLYSMLYNMCKSLIKKEWLFSKNSKKWTVRVCLCITGMNGASYRCIAMHCRANCLINSIHCNFRNWVEM